MAQGLHQTGRSQRQILVRSEWRSHRYRVGDGFELVRLEDLGAEVASSFNKLATRSKLFGVLRPRIGRQGPTWLATSRVAKIFETCRDWSSLGCLDEAVEEEGLIERLVLDGVLQIKDGDSAVSGAAALTALGLPPIATDSFRQNAKLSFAALSYGQDLYLRDHARLSAKLYFYNRSPSSPSWRRELASSEAVLQFCLSGRPPPSESAWVYHPPTGIDWNWHYWQSRWFNDKPSLIVKLYICPIAPEIPGVLSEVFRSLDDSRALGMKIPASASDLHRPDKIIIYFDAISNMQIFAQCLERQLRGCRAQPVPFAANIDGEGLMAWGMDPTSTISRGLLRMSTSWRTVMCDLLAGALIAGATYPNDEVPPSLFSLHRISLEGINPATWAPATSTDGNRERVS